MEKEVGWGGIMWRKMSGEPRLCWSGAYCADQEAGQEQRQSVQTGGRDIVQMDEECGVNGGSGGVGRVAMAVFQCGLTFGNYLF